MEADTKIQLEAVISQMIADGEKINVSRVAQKAGVAGNAASLGRAGQIFYMAHQKALFIGAGGHKAPHCPGSRINRTRHCSPARPADRP